MDRMGFGGFCAAGAIFFDLLWVFLVFYLWMSQKWIGWKGWSQLFVRMDPLCAKGLKGDIMLTTFSLNISLSHRYGL